MFLAYSLIASQTTTYLNKDLVKMMTELGSKNGEMKAQMECLENELRRMQVCPKDYTHSTQEFLLIEYLYFKDQMEKLQEQQDISQGNIKELEGKNKALRIYDCNRIHEHFDIIID